MTVDSKDNIFLTGSTYDLATGFIFVLMYNGDGNVLWNTTWGDKLAMITEGFGVAVDFSDNIYISGYTDYYKVNRDDILLLKYSTEIINKIPITPSLPPHEFFVIFIKSVISSSVLFKKWTDVNISSSISV